LSRDATTGALTLSSATTDCFRGTTSTEVNCGTATDASGQTKGLNGAAGVAVTPDGKSVYVASTDSDAVVGFVRNTTTGAISTPSCVHGSNTPVGDCTGSPVGGLNGARGIAVTDGNVYVASGPSSGVNT